MADISKCTGILRKESGGEDNICPLRDQCYRYTAPSSEFWQSYMHTPGYFENGEFVCNFKWILNE